LRKLSSKGFTLIETVVFIIVLGVILGILIPFTVSMKGSPNPVAVQQAMALAQAELDQTVAQKHAAGFGSVVAGCVVPMTGAFTCSRTVCFVPAANLNDTSNCATATNFKRIQVTVANPVTSVTAVTLLTNS
jgi:type II secretory pathway pseudopilin PulG